MKHIIFYSGGLGSWMTAKRVVEKEGKENVILFFTDTKTEDEDLYRFINETVEKLGCEFVSIEDGRDVWEVFHDSRFLGNSRIAPCTTILKQKLAKKWIKANYKPDECILYLGIDWSEIHRTEAPRRNWKPYTIEYPMCDEPYLSKGDVMNELMRDGIEVPKLYNMGFAHNNCGGFCVKAGQAHFKNLYKTMPERYMYHANKEQEIREYLGKDVSILTRVKNGIEYNLTLKQLAYEIEHDPKQIDLFDFGGCGCFVDEG